MEIRPLPAEEAAIRRFVDDLFVSYNRDLEAIVDRFALDDGVDPASSERTFWLDRLDDEDHRTWVAVDGPAEADDFAAVDGDLVGFVATDVEESPAPFDRPDRLCICDRYVREPHRGTGLARELFERARTRARETGCGEFRLEVDADNERAVACYEKLCSEVARHEMLADVERG
ncbi:MAG: GNAT family N-acetyltransferase [Halobacteriales archaeon]